MFAGHIGAGLAIARAERQVNAGAFVLAALLLDVLLWLFVLVGWESVRLPAPGAGPRAPAFVFPYSHGLLASLAWSALAGAAAVLLRPPRAVKAAALVGGAVFSHWLLDALVHEPEMPLAGPGSAMVGLGLWRTLPAALGVEALVLLAGLRLFVAGAPLSRVRRAGLVALSLGALALTVAGMTVAPPPPSARAMAATSLVTLAAVCGVAGWLGRVPARRADRPGAG
jgi:hypothetical protein